MDEAVKRTMIVWCDAKGEWRWTLQAGNRRIIGTSGEGYRDQSHAIKMAEEIAPKANLEIRDPA